MSRYTFLAVVAAVTIGSGACAASGPSSPDTGERISKRGDQIDNYGKAWSDGKQDVTRGEKRISKSSEKLADAEKALARARGQVAKAERQISDASADKADGERLVEEGTVQMERAEAAYRAVRAGPSALAP